MSLKPSTLELLLYLNSLGNVAPLEQFLNVRTLRQEIAPFEGDWKPYNPGKKGNSRWGLSLTSLDGGLSGVPDLYSLKDYNNEHQTSYREDQFNVFTPVYKESKELQKTLPGLTKNTPLGRSHILKMDQGSFFPPHRDNALLAPECFRVFVSLSFSSESYSFVIDGKQYFFEAGLFYLMNTTLMHSLSSFKDNQCFIVLNVPLTVENVEHISLQLTSN